jgi:CheY-like chemotaxis protein
VIIVVVFADLNTGRIAHIINLSYLSVMPHDPRRTAPAETGLGFDFIDSCGIYPLRDCCFYGDATMNHSSTPTPAGQEKMFLISEWELDRMFTNSDNYELLDRIRSRPTPAPTSEPKYKPDDYDMTCNTAIHRDIAARAASKAREQALDELRIKYVDYMNHPCPELAEKYKHGCDAEYCGLCILDEVLESLRQHKGGKE